MQPIFIRTFLASLALLTVYVVPAQTQARIAWGDLGQSPISKVDILRQIAHPIRWEAPGGSRELAARVEMQVTFADRQRTLETPAFLSIRARNWLRDLPEEGELVIQIYAYPEDAQPIVTQIWTLQP